MNLIIKASPSSKKRGEEREGNYAARAQVGTEKDGSPMYRYFKTMEQYKNYMDKKGTTPKKKPSKVEDDDESLKDKTNKEHKESTKKVRESHRRAKERNLFVGKNKEATKKALLYIKGDK